MIKYISAIFIALNFFTALATYTFTSTCGYKVHVDIVPTEIITSNGNICPWGYNYNVKFFYNITVEGTIPNGSCGNTGSGSLFTSQVIITCNNQENGFYNLPKNVGNGYAVTVNNPAIPYSSQNTYTLPNVHCRDANVSNLNCNKIQLILAGPGLNVNEIIESTPVTPLGDNLIYFDGKLLNKDQALLTWKMTEYQRINSFTIHHFDNNGKILSENKLLAKNLLNTNDEFEMIHSDLLIGNNYFSITAEDAQGNLSNLGTRIVKNTFVDNFLIYPNPITNDELNIYFPENGQEVSTVKLFNLFGQLVWEKEYSKVIQELKIEVPFSGNQFILEIQLTNGENIRQKIAKI